MSLHLGNLSSHVRIHELERVFQRFGRCHVRVKDRFGFVVYDFPGNAEKALKSLRGKKICGELISISWSNRQPRPLPGTATGDSSYGSHHPRNSTGRRDFKMGSKPPDSDGRRFKSADQFEKAAINDPGNGKGHVTERDQIIGEDIADEGGGPKSTILVNDRWEEQAGNLSYENGVQNGVEFDRYEPYQVDGDDRRDKDESYHEIHQDGSPIVTDSQKMPGIMESGKATVKKPDKMKSKQTCYTCGEIGHKMRNCPRKNDAKIMKSRFNLRRGNEVNYMDKGEYQLKKVGSKSQGSQQPGRDAVRERAHKRERDVSGSRQPRKLIKSGHSRVERTRSNHLGKKRRRRDNGSPERGHAKKSRSSLLTPAHSDYTASKSKTKRSASRSTSHSRFRSRSLSSLRSNSTSHQIKSEKNKLGSRSQSRSRSSSAVHGSLSASLHQSLVSSPNKEQTNCRKSLEKASSPESEEISFGRRQPIETDIGSGNSKRETVMLAVENGSAAPYEVDGYKNHFQKTNDDKLAVCRDLTEGTDFVVQSKGADLTGGNFSPSRLRETTNPQNCDVCISEDMPVTTKNPESEAVLRSHIVNSTNITADEMRMALKHYGLQHQEETEEDLPVEAYFGSARLWPWEIIYYRRLRKGPISTENYAKRIAQNEEFGIVDKYVRSSSGWGEQEERGI